MAKREQTVNEEYANAVTHGLGILFCLITTPILIANAMEYGTSRTVWAVSIFGFGMLTVYLSSTLYHASQNAKTKRVLQIWDHVSIFFLIAGSYTPIVQKYIDPTTGFYFLAAMWSVVFIGSIFKIFFTGKFKVLSLVLYLAMGWMALFIIKPLYNNIPNEVAIWLLIGGLSYTVGTVFYSWNNLKYAHAIWHLFVLGGTVTHFIAIYIGTKLSLNF